MNQSLFPEPPPASKSEPGFDVELSKNARRQFNRLRREYDIQDPAGLLLLRTAFEAYDEMRSAQAEMNGQPIYKDRFGQPQEHPAAKVIRASRTQMIQALKALKLDFETEDIDE